MTAVEKTRREREALSSMHRPKPGFRNVCLSSCTHLGASTGIACCKFFPILGVLSCPADDRYGGSVGELEAVALACADRADLVL